MIHLAAWEKALTKGELLSFSSMQGRHGPLELIVLPSGAVKDRPFPACNGAGGVCFPSIGKVPAWD